MCVCACVSVIKESTYSGLVTCVEMVMVINTVNIRINGIHG